MPVSLNSMFYCDHLGASENDRQDILTFSVMDSRGEGLVKYLQHLAFLEEAEGNMRTYLVKNNRSSELVGYFSLKAGLVSFNEIKTDTGADFDTLPGIELANFAINNNYTKKHPDSKGAGSTIFNDFIRPLVENIAKHVGVKVIYLFALPVDKLIYRYTQYGFKRLEAEQETELHSRLKPRYDRECIFMYQML